MGNKGRSGARGFEDIHRGFCSRKYPCTGSSRGSHPYISAWYMKRVAQQHCSKSAMVSSAASAACGQSCPSHLPARIGATMQPTKRCHRSEPRGNGLIIFVVLAVFASVSALLGVYHSAWPMCSTTTTTTRTTKIVLTGLGPVPVNSSNPDTKSATELWQPYASTEAASLARAVVANHFPQSTRCAASSNWQMEYATLHSRITAGKALPRYVTNVAIRKGVADRVTGWVSMFYLALLSNRAITTTFEYPLPGFEAACDMPYINWTQPFAHPDGALDLADLYHKGMSEMDAERSHPKEGPINSTTYHILYVTNQEMKLGTKHGFFQDHNLTRYPPGNEQVPYIITSSNRGQTYKLAALNPYHRQQPWSFGLSPETAYMCGFFYLCSPNSAVQELYRPYWDTLSRPGLLKIGIMVRVGDHMFRGNTQSDNATAVAYLNGPGDVYFQCAASVEKAFKVPSQQVVWYLISDSLAVRQAAKSKFGDKLLTDLSTKIIHPDCQTHNPEACNDGSMNRSMQHSMGQLFTYSLADYHIHTKDSGFGRLGAWASGKYNNLFEMSPGQPKACDAHRPTSHQRSAEEWAQV